MYSIGTIGLEGGCMGGGGGERKRKERSGEKREEENGNKPTQWGKRC